MDGVKKPTNVEKEKLSSVVLLQELLTWVVLTHQKKNS